MIPSTATAAIISLVEVQIHIQFLVDAYIALRLFDFLCTQFNWVGY